MERARDSGRQATPRRTAIRIVLIDDDASDRERLAGIVRSDVAPVEVQEIRDHVSFFQALKNPDFDLVITEQDLHWSSGREVLTAVKSLRPSIPVIMVARSEDERLASEALKEGLDAYIPKSGELAIRLRSSVRSALQRIEMADRADSLETRLQSLLDRLNVGVFRATVDGQIREANAAFLRLVGAPNIRAARQLSLGALFVDAAVHRGLMARLEAEGQVRDFQAELRRPDGSGVWVSLTETVQQIPGGERVVDGLVEDVTLARQAQEALRRASQDYRAVFEVTSAATAVVDESGAIAMANSAFERISGYSRGELEGVRPWAEFISPSDMDRVREQVAAVHADPSASPRSARFDFVDRTGQTLHVLATVAAMPRARRTVVSLLNLTERQEVEEQLLHNAFHDGLTGLPNRLSLLDRIETLLSQRDDEAGRRFALVLMGLDSFRVINDVLGHRIGDLLLQAVTRRLERLQEIDTLARCGGDVFGLLLGPGTTAGEATAVTEKISDVLEEPFLFGDHEVRCTAGFGVAVSDGGRDANDLYRDAESALYEAKRSGRGRSMVFAPPMHERMAEAFRIETELRAAAGGRVEVVYQPIATLSDGTIHGFDARIRWQGGEAGEASADRALEVAEETGLIVAIGGEAIRTACRHLRRWHEAAQDPRERLFVSVDLSARQLLQDDLVPMVREILEASEVSPSHLMIEVSEGLVGDRSDGAAGSLTQLDRLGVELCLDRFGAGIYPVAALHRFPFTSAKIDRSLLAGIGDDRDRWRLLDGLVALVLHLGVRPIIDGIEEQQQLRRLLDLGCTIGQGELLCGAVNGQTADELARNRRLW